MPSMENFSVGDAVSVAADGGAEVGGVGFPSGEVVVSVG